MEVSGFIVDILSPQTHERISAETEIEIGANVILMCGCPVTPNGIWNADDYEIKALLTKEGEEPIELNLLAEDKPSTFSGKISLSPGYYEILVYAFDPKTGNSGLDKTNIIIN